MEREKSLQQSLQSETRRHSASLIKEWLFRFGVEHKEDVEPRLPAWLEVFVGMEPVLLDKLFTKAYTKLKYFPKISEILAPINEIKKIAGLEEAELAWQEVLKIRQEHWNPDIPQHLDRVLEKLPERKRQALRAAGIFRDFEELEGLHVWAKKRFCESYLAYERLEEDQYLLPDGMKEIFAELGRAKALSGTKLLKK